MNKYTVLFVDDEEQNQLAFQHAFFKQYHILTASSGQEALAVLEQEPVQLIVSDQRMPHMTGIEFLTLTKEKYPDTMRVIVTGYSDVEVVMQAVNQAGIFHYALKPWNNAELKIVLDNALDKYQLKADKEGLIEELRLLNSNLESKVEQRTRELSARTEELAARNEEYRQLHQVKDKLFSIVSHDLRGPLQSLSLFLDLLLEKEGKFTPEVIQEILSELQRSVVNLNEMLNNLLSWSYNQFNQGETVFTEVSLQSLLEKHLAVYQPMASQKNIILAARFEFPGEPVWGSPDQISVILRNLLGNAIKFTPAGGRITLSVHGKQDYVEVAVADTGVGIAAEDLPKVYAADSFFTTIGTDREKGTGLGLKLCQEYAQKQGGSLQVESCLGQGTTFTFTLPLMRAVAV